MTRAEWAKRIEAVRPKVGARVEYAHPPDEAGVLGCVLAVGDGRDGWAAVVEWDEGSHRRSPEALGPEAVIVGLVTVLP